MARTVAQNALEYKRSFRRGRRIGRVTNNTDIVSDSFVSGAMKVSCVLGRAGAGARERYRRSAGKHRGAVNVNLIDQALIERLTKDVASAFNKNTRDFFRA